MIGSQLSPGTWCTAARRERGVLTPGRPVACHEHGTALSGFLPASWDHLGCQSWDHPARRVEGFSVRSLTRHVLFIDVEVIRRGIQGGQCG